MTMISMLTGKRFNETPTIGDMQDEAYADYLEQIEEMHPDTTPLNFKVWLETKDGKDHVKSYCKVWGLMK